MKRSLPEISPVARCPHCDGELPAREVPAAREPGSLVPLTATDAGSTVAEIADEIRTVTVLFEHGRSNGYRADD